MNDSRTKRAPFTRTLLALAVGAAGAGGAAGAHAGAVIFDTGDAATASVALGVNDEGHLNFDSPLFQTENAGPFGIAGRDTESGLFFDATSPGCLCEGWGVALTGGGGAVSAFAAENIANNGGIGGIADVSFTSTASSATSLVTMSDAPVTISHSYGNSLAPGVFQGNVTITNNSATETFSDLVYRRAMDWDVPPTEFSEYVTHEGVEDNLEANGGNVRAAVDNGFVPVDPLVALDPSDEILVGTFNADFVDSGPADHGSVFDFAFGDLAPGESRNFNIFYGVQNNEDSALAAIQTLGADVYSLGQSNPAFLDGGGGYGGEYGGEFDLVGAAAAVGVFDEHTAGPGPGNPDGTPATYIFAFGGVGGIEPGTDQDNPFLPFTDPDEPLVFEFPEPVPFRWFDPPTVGGFEYTLEGGGVFTLVEAPDGFDDLIVTVDGMVVDGDFDGGDEIMFDPMDMITSFTITGITPLLDPDLPGFTTAFPTFLGFTTVPGGLLRMEGIDVTSPGGGGGGKPPAVPAPGVLGLFGLCLFGFGLRAAQRRS